MAKRIKDGNLKAKGNWSMMGVVDKTGDAPKFPILELLVEWILWNVCHRQCASPWSSGGVNRSGVHQATSLIVFPQAKYNGIHKCISGNYFPLKLLLQPEVCEWNIPSCGRNTKYWNTVLLKYIQISCGATPSRPFTWLEWTNLRNSPEQISDRQWTKEPAPPGE